MVDRVPALVAQELRARLRRAALDLHHLAELELLEPRVGEVERDRDGRLALRAEPFVAEIAGGADGQAARLELAIEARHAAFERAPLDPHREVADAQGKELLVSQGDPGGIHSGETSNPLASAAPEL